MINQTPTSITPVTPEVVSWLAGAQQIINEYFAANYISLQPPVLLIEQGSRYLKVVRKDRPEQAGASVHAFIDRTNGDVLKPASWKSPAKHARGNVFDSNNGLGTMKWTGPAYLR